MLTVFKLIRFLLKSQKLNVILEQVTIKTIIATVSWYSLNVDVKC